MSHLIERDPAIKESDMWTRVFSRDDGTESMVAIHKIGTDLSYDKAVRESLNDFDG